jgi:hypothetical protein
MASPSYLVWLRAMIHPVDENAQKYINYETIVYIDEPETEGGEARMR